MERTISVYRIGLNGHELFKTYKGQYRILCYRDTPTGIISIIDSKGEILFVGATETFCIAEEIGAK